MPAPTVTSVTPPSGVARGGSLVTIAGTLFDASSDEDTGAAEVSVTFDGRAATDVRVQSATSLTCIVPRGDLPTKKDDPETLSVDIVITNFNSEGTLPENFEALVAQAVLDFGNANARVDQDVLFQQFIGPTAAAIQDVFTGKFVYDLIECFIGTTASTALTNIPIGIRERADFDSARITVSL